MKAIILAGGSGTRLWPLSRRGFPKQFLPFADGRSLLEDALRRAVSVAGEDGVAIVTGQAIVPLVQDAVRMAAPAALPHVLCEPQPRSTAPAVTLAVAYLVESMETGQDEPVFVFPSDHLLAPAEQLGRFFEAGATAARDGFLVTFGVRPARAETGYGYLQVGEQRGPYDLCTRFVEKPQAAEAAQLVASGQYLWNTGIFAFTPAVFRAALTQCAPDIAALAVRGYTGMVGCWADMPSISLDYAVMEKASNVAAVPMDVSWSDVGSWDSWYSLQKPDANGNVLAGDAVALDTRNSLVVSTSRLVGTVGIDGVTVVETGDAVLVAGRGRGQEVGQLAQTLEAQRRTETADPVEVRRPWGRYRVLEVGPRFKIKSVMVDPGQSLSLQRHHHRTEHWVVIRGTAQVTVDGRTYAVHEGESTFVPKEALHRLSNAGTEPLELIEVQNGEYVGEDDIERIEDAYGRADWHDKGS